MGSLYIAMILITLAMLVSGYIGFILGRKFS